VQILINNNIGERKPSSQTEAEIKILRSKRNEDITEELERNLKTQFQLPKKKKKWDDAENDKQKSQ